MRESTFCFWEDADFNVLVDEPFEPAEVFWHPTDNPMIGECWFFELLGDNSLHFGLSIFTKDPFALPCSLSPGIILSFNSPEHAFSQSFVYPATAWESSQDEFVVKVDANEIAGLWPNYRVKVTTPQLTANLRLKASVSAWKPGSGMVRYADKGKKALSWLVPVPRGEVTGIITFSGQCYEVSATGYLDYKLFNFDLRDTISQAIWGRAYGDEYSLIFAQLTGTRLFSFERIHSVLLKEHDETMSSSPCMELVTRFNTKHFNGGLRYPRQIFVRGQDGVPLEAKMESHLLNYHCFGKTKKEPVQVTMLLRGSMNLGLYPVKTSGLRGACQMLSVHK